MKKTTERLVTPTPCLADAVLIAVADFHAKGRALVTYPQIRYSNAVADWLEPYQDDLGLWLTVEELVRAGRLEQVGYGYRVVGVGGAKE